MTETWSDGQHNFVVFVGAIDQTIEIGGLEILNYRDPYRVDALPRTGSTYAGRGADAPWRAEAQARIVEHRMAPATMEVVNPQGNPLADA